MGIVLTNSVQGEDDVKFRPWVYKKSLQPLLVSNALTIMYLKGYIKSKVTTNIRQEIYYSERIKGRYKLNIINEILKYYKCYMDWIITTNTELQMVEL